MDLNNLPSVSIVIIGRNEAGNLPACIRSIREMNYPREKLEILYVDTDSNDGSPEIAKSLGVMVYEEHSNFPSPGRARNRGWREAKYAIVHFVDGDMTVASEYLRQAVLYLGEDGIACVIGGLQERYATRRLITRIVEYPWKVKVPGLISAPGAGGTFLKSVLAEVGGYNPDLARSEETDLGERLHEKGYQVLMIETIMGIHDYGINNPGALWEFYQNRGRSFARISRFPLKKSISADKRASRHNQIECGLTLLVLLGVCISRLWWLLLILIALLIFYVIIRYWQPGRLRGLRIAYFLLDYFFKPAVWVGMAQYYLGQVLGKN